MSTSKLGKVQLIPFMRDGWNSDVLHLLSIVSYSELSGCLQDNFQIC